MEKIYRVMNPWTPIIKFLEENYDFRYNKKLPLIEYSIKNKNKWKYFSYKDSEDLEKLMSEKFIFCFDLLYTIILDKLNKSRTNNFHKNITKDIFMEILEFKNYKYIVKKDKIVIIHNGDVHFNSLEFLPKGIAFYNIGDVYLDCVKVLNEDTFFKNKGSVILSSLNILPVNFIFENEGHIFLYNLKKIPLGVKFLNAGDLHFSNLKYLSLKNKLDNFGDIVFNDVIRVQKGYVFENKGDVYFHWNKSIPKGISLANKGRIYYLEDEYEIIPLF